ncbi:MAG: hypothetical protein E2O39_14290 [Planctomycetota bacterium]|nr:MAG: hypothetical protein E2O39_14290 [Planctomycetota bacterium]
MTTTTTRTHCPNCGAKLPEQPLSLCAYCAMPVDLAPEPAGAPTKASPNAERLRQVEQSDKLAAAMAWVPPESMAFQQGWRMGHRGKSLFVVAAVLILVSRLVGGSEAASGVLAQFNVLALGLGIAVAARAFFISFKGAAMRKEATSLPLLKRTAVITDRRSETVLKGLGGSTCYFFTIEFAEGVVAEFAYPGHGSNEEPYVSNLTGVAYTRGRSLLAFKHVRI